MIDSNQQNSNSLILVIILLSIISCCPSLVTAQSSDLTITQYITTRQKNETNSTIFTFESSHNPQLDDSSQHDLEIVNLNDNQKGIRLRNAIKNNLTFDIVFETNIRIRINVEFLNPCESCTSSCTVIIAFLASLCLILFTALALALIILRRKKPITFKFGQQSERDNNERVQFNGANDYEENLNESRKQSVYDVSNGILHIKSVTPVSETTPTYPRKSSLKPPKNGNFSEQINNNNNINLKNSKANTKANSHVNEAYIGDLDKVEEEIEDKPNEGPVQFQEHRRKSIVTFNEKIDVKSS